MATLTFDTLKFARRLTDAGVPAAHAEAEAAALSEALEVNLRELATKQDLVELEKRLESRMETMELRLAIKLGTLMAVSVGLVAALVKLL